ncbi:Ribonuclease H2 subunit B [Habropoda laboriosa]|uniref:Ribonuclease H2 subunit B n=1 Tax=Habropoda laboriosa TaxID=597456 RepID=A0A0L7R3W6_9HYME|nr:PREDICTED: ribonuclease H2 subunit B [Habropoda laboriosa]KOC65441.1 Ribonuclease H2 subunit B [Habropoda laboriosa]
MPRTKASPKKCVKTTNSHPSTNTWIFLMKDDGFDNTDGGVPDVIKLRHPALNQPAMFVFSPGNLTVQEVLTFDENKRSWFIDDNVKSDGKLHLSTPIDPIFLILPYLRKSQQAQPLEQCLWDEDFPETSRLIQCQNLKLASIADRKGNESLQAYKFNEEKTLMWLQKKVERVVEVLKQKDIHVSQGAISATYVKSSKLETVSEMEYLKYAHGIVSEYLAEDLSKKLAQHLNLPDETENKKRKLNSPKDTTDEKRSKKDTTENESILKPKIPDSTKLEKPQKTAIGKKELARQKAATGSKSITNFFKKK